MARDASLALMFSEVPIAVARLALCLRTQRRIGSAHALLHLRRLAAACLRQSLVDDSRSGTAARRMAIAIVQPLKELDDALAADRLPPPAIADTTFRLSFVRFQLWQLGRHFGVDGMQAG
jgi:hypothetical protein